MLEDVSGEKIEVELDSPAAVSPLDGVDPTNKLLVVRNFSLEKRITPGQPFALVCYHGVERATFVRAYEPNGTTGKLLWNQALQKHAHRCTNFTDSIPSHSVTTEQATQPNISILLAEMKGKLSSHTLSIEEVNARLDSLEPRVLQLECAIQNKGMSQTI
ncbi:MAG: hypothetical protein ACK52I_36005 [Pseudomonadota bacterium]|jgi:hypothetical protein